MTDSFGLNRLRGKLSANTARLVQNIQDAHTLARKYERVAGDSAERVNNQKIILEKLITAQNDIGSIIGAMQVEEAKATEAAEVAIDASIDAAQLARQIEEFKTQGYDSAVATVLALMSRDYVLAAALRDDETIDRALDQIGLDRVDDWVKRQNG